MHTRQRTRISGGTLTRQAARAAGACAEGARAAGARADGAWPRKRPREGRESRVPCGGRWRDRRADAQHRPRCIPHSNPRVRSCGKGRDGARQWCRAIRVRCVDGATVTRKRLRRSRWERGTYERVARGGVRPMAGAGGRTTGSR